MKEFDALDLFAVVRELKTIEGKKIRKVGGRGDVIKLSAGKEVILADFCFISHHKLETEHNKEILFLKSRLEGERIESVRQLGFDRILEIKTENHALYLELLKQKNLVLTDAEGKIIYVRNPRSWRHRTLKKGEIYKTPPLKGFPSFSWQEGKAVVEMIKDGVPPTYAREILYRLGVEEGAEASAVDPEEARRVWESILKEAEKGKGYLIRGEPFPVLVTHLGEPEEEFETFSEALSKYFFEILLPSKLKDRKLETMRKSLEEMQRRLEEMEKAAELLSTNLYRIQRAIEIARTIKKPKLVLEELKKLETDRLKFVAFDPARKKLTLRLELESAPRQ